MVMLFWLTITIIMLTSMLVLFFAANRSTDTRSAVASDKSLYNARLKEIDSDIRLGRLDEQSAEAARTEEARKLLRLSAQEDADDNNRRTNNNFTMLAALVFLPIFSISLYLAIGEPEYKPQTQVADTGEPTVEALLVAAEKRLKEAPDDLQGWKVVAPVYMRLERYQDAERAYQNIIRLDGRSPQNLASLAEANVIRHSGLVTNPALKLFNEVISSQPNNPVARYHIGLAAYQANKFPEAKLIWQGMLDKAKGNEAWVPVVRNSLSSIETGQNSSAPLKLNEEQQELVAGMVEGLAERLKETPNDHEGWKRLIRAYTVLGDEPSAKAAYKTAVETFADDQEYAAELRRILEGGRVQ
ncbi:MAG: c-type cytochrome biogenesis protein CcmI [Pseudomonadota bacterium]